MGSAEAGPSDRASQLPDSAVDSLADTLIGLKYLDGNGYIPPTPLPGFGLGPPFYDPPYVSDPGGTPATPPSLYCPSDPEGTKFGYYEHKGQGGYHHSTYSVAREVFGYAQQNPRSDWPCTLNWPKLGGPLIEDYTYGTLTNANPDIAWLMDRSHGMGGFYLHTGTAWWSYWEEPVLYGGYWHVGKMNVLWGDGHASGVP